MVNLCRRSTFVEGQLLAPDSSYEEAQERRAPAPRLRGGALPPSFFSFTLLLSSLESSDAKVYEPYIRALLGAASQFCGVVVLKSRTPPRTDSGRARGGDTEKL